jgi:hypothetical protein
VFRAWVSPDGHHYAYTVNPVGATGPVTGTVHIVDVATGADRPLTVPSTSNVLSYEAEGVYIVHVVPASGAPTSGLTLVDPSSGSFRQITAQGIWNAVGGGFAWGADLDSSIPAPSGGNPNPANRLRKVDLKTGAITVVAQYPGTDVEVLGIDAGQPVVASGQVPNGPAYSISRLDGTKMFAGPVSNSNPTSPIVSDGGAIWFSSRSGAVWRWDDPQVGIHQVASTPLSGLMVAGACR